MNLEWGVSVSDNNKRGGIFYIESDKDFHLLVKHTLNGKTVDACFPTLKDVLPKIEQNNYEAILIDWRLRGGDVSVFDFIKNIQSMTATPIYVLSSERQEQVMEGLRENGIQGVGYISKGEAFDALIRLFK